MKYTQHLLDSFYGSENCGVIQGADFAFKSEDKKTGDAVKLFFLLDGLVVKDVKFQACGSIVLFASMSSIASIIKGKTIQEALEVSEKQVVKEIKQVNRCDYSIVSFCVNVLHLALNLIIKKQDKIAQNKGLKKVKIKEFIASKNILVYGQEVLENKDITPVTNTEIKSDKEVKTERIEIQDDFNQEEIEKIEAILEKPLHIEEILGVEEQDEKEENIVLDSVPTKIEVRVLEEDEDSEEVAENSNYTSTNENSIEENKKETIIDASLDEEMIDEIDSITAKLTDAITKLNFKFDVDEDN